jgi:small-conductance mechanosensitive channel
VFSNFVSGLWLLFEGSLKPGEVLVHDGDVCKVQSLGLRAATLLRTSDNAELLVPNQTFFTATTTTYTGTATLRCGSLNVRADYDHSPEQVIAILLEIAKANPRVMSNPPPSAKLAEFLDGRTHNQGWHCRRTPARHLEPLPTRGHQDSPHPPTSPDRPD